MNICHKVSAFAVMVMLSASSAFAVLTGAPAGVEAQAISTELSTIGLDAAQLAITGIGVGLVIFGLVYGIRKAKKGANAAS